MIKVTDLDFIYKRSGKHAVRGISFDVGNGEIFGLLGPSGAGKTTTQRLIIGLINGYMGSIRIMEKERHLWGRDLYEHIGVAFDFPNLYLKLTAKENLQLIARYYGKSTNDVEELLDMVGLLSVMDKRVEGFSKGMKMRLNFIRPLLHEPDILFFDEPTAGLDPVNAKTIKDTILRLKTEGKTVFLTSHNMQVAEQLCDRVAFMADGEIPVIDSPEQLMIRYGKRTVEVLAKNGERHLFPMEGMSKVPLFQQLLDGDAIETIHSNEASLEEVFIQLTGRSLVE